MRILQILFFIFSFNIALAQNDAEIKVSDEKNRIDVSQQGSNKQNKAKVDASGKEHNVKLNQSQTHSSDSLIYKNRPFLTQIKEVGESIDPWVAISASVISMLVALGVFNYRKIKK